MLHKILALVLVLLTTQFASAQYNSPRGRVPSSRLGLSVGAKIGGNMFLGDLMDSGNLGWAFGAFVEKNALSWFALRGSLDIGQAHGTGEQGNKFEFTTTYFNLSGFFKMHFLDLIQGYDDGRMFNPYVALGGGGVFFKAKKDPTEECDVEGFLARAEKGGYVDLMNKYLYYDDFDVSGVVSGIIGVRYAYSSKLYFILEARADYIFSDWFDGQQGWVGGGKWYDSEGDDALGTLSIGVQYRFYDFNKWTYRSKYSRKAYLYNRTAYERNAGRMRRR